MEMSLVSMTVFFQDMHVSSTNDFKWHVPGRDGCVCVNQLSSFEGKALKNDSRENLQLPTISAALRTCDSGLKVESGE